MSTFTTTCPRCGGITLSPQDIQLWVFPDGVDDDVYAFTCPDCGQHITKPASAGTVQLLRRGGVQPVAIGRHPEARPTGLPPLTHHDLVAFRELLQQPDWFDALVHDHHG